MSDNIAVYRLLGRAQASEPGHTRQFIDILLLMTKHPQNDVKQAVSLCVRRRAFAYEAVLSVLRNEPVRSSGQLDLSHRPELTNIDDGTRPACLYDQLQSHTAHEEILV